MNSQFHAFAAHLAALSSTFANEQPLPASLLMRASGKLAVYYAPFDHVTTTAQVVLVGITPGQTQAHLAIRAAREALSQHGLDEASRLAKTAASFGGPMRANLIAMLDGVGLALKLGIDSCAALWAERSDLVHFTSALRYPVFKDGENYGGGSLLTTPLLRDEVERWFLPECRALPNALFFPLGPAANDACRHAIAAGALKDSQLVDGLPHPSPANAERIAYFLGRKSRDALSSKTNATRIDEAKERIHLRVAGWR